MKPLLLHLLPYCLSYHSQTYNSREMLILSWRPGGAGIGSIKCAAKTNRMLSHSAFARAIKVACE
jgi:hypothetical protein